MSNVRIKFTKTGVLKFIGHLDVMRYFQKAMRRADIPIAFTGGFSPHMVMSFANPLGIGLTSEGEYFDIEVTEDIPSAEAVKRLNAVMVDGISVRSFRYLPENSKTGMSIIAAADYLVFPKYENAFPESVTEDLIRGFMEQEEIQIVKKTKKSEKEVNIRPLIYAMELRKDGIFLNLSAGSVENLKPQLVMTAFEAYAKSQGVLSDDKLPELQYHRVEMYAAENDRFISLDEIGADLS
jgi:radical SAM-linked protein